MLKKRTVDKQRTRSSPAGQLHDWQVRRVCEYIDARFGAPIRVCDLSAIAQRSECHFARAFKRTFGETPHDYVVRRRVELASQMMLMSDAPLSEIAVTCGFSDQAHLSKRFRRYLGQTPGAWRRVRMLTPKHSGADVASSPVPAPTTTERSLLRE
jgi:AraC family transcriptional regulator